MWRRKERVVLYLLIFIMMETQMFDMFRKYIRKKQQL